MIGTYVCLRFAFVMVCAASEQSDTHPPPVIKGFVAGFPLSWESFPDGHAGGDRNQHYPLCSSYYHLVWHARREIDKKQGRRRV
ncbi:hypothetical protein BX600DRAFT_469416 [Xylariales sp. PMI_506]|nr:hypothetical protein BX600DRAFT_469416 [Xylariales sp. PMI_506]